MATRSSALKALAGTSFKWWPYIRPSEAGHLLREETRCKLWAALRRSRTIRQSELGTISEQPSYSVRGRAEMQLAGGTMTSYTRAAILSINQTISVKGRARASQSSE